MPAIAVFCIATFAGKGLCGASPEQYRECVATWYDNILKYGHDDGKKTPLFADGIDVERKTAGAAPNGTIPCNFAHQQYLLRGLVALSHVTGESKYRDAAGDATRYVLAHLVNPKSGLIHWGGHAYWDLQANGPCFAAHNSHELKNDFPFYEFLYEVDPQATRKFIESYWTAHVDLDDPWLMFGRHAKMERAGPRGKVKPGELAFIDAGADLFYAAGFLFSKTQDPVWRERAVGLAERFARLKDPKTGLAPEILDAHDPAFDRPCYRLSLGHLGIGAHNLLIYYGRRSDYFALCQLYLAETLPGDSAGKFRAWALDDLQAYARHCYDPKQRAFYEMCRTDTGERIEFSQVRWIPTDPEGHYILPYAFYPNKGLPLLFLAYARGYKLSGDPSIRQTALQCLERLKIERSQPASLSGIADEYLKSDSAACLIQGLLDLYEVERDAWYLDSAKCLADDAMGRFFNGQFFFDWPHEFRYSRVNQGLPLALLKLYAVASRLKVALPQDVGGYGMEGTRPNLITSMDGDLALRFMWSNHHLDIRGGNVCARVGDCFPHNGAVEGDFGSPGLWRLATLQHPDNLLDGKRGMVFEPAQSVATRDLRKLNDQEVQIEHWQYQDGPVKHPYFGIRMNYRVASPDSLSWTLEVTPLEENYGNLSLRGMAYLNGNASPGFTYSGADGLIYQELPATGETVVKPQAGAGATARGYRNPLFYSRIENVLLVFMFPPGAPIDLVGTGPSAKNPGGLRGFIWHVDDARKGQAYTLKVLVKILPLSGERDVMRQYDQWSQ